MGGSNTLSNLDAICTISTGEVQAWQIGQQMRPSKTWIWWDKLKWEKNNINLGLEHQDCLMGNFVDSLVKFSDTKDIWQLGRL